MNIKVTYRAFPGEEVKHYSLSVPNEEYEWHNNKPIGLLETVFRMMNHVDDSEIEDQLKSFKCRSMCVGDEVELEDGTKWHCDFVGWSKVG